VKIENERERGLFNSMRCMCGSCERLPLTSCGCPDADEAREMIRSKITAGETNEQILLAYQKLHGADGLTIPPNKGGMQVIYAVPVLAIVGGGAGVILLVRRWNKRSPETKKPAKKGKPERDAYDERLDDELRDLDE
jgi:cytochrome c-type biogenesis protein CcmH/NrfF